MLRRMTAASAAAMLSLSLPAAAPAASAKTVRAKCYPNCAALNKDYPHGVGKNGARDRSTPALIGQICRVTAVPTRRGAWQTR